MKKYKILITFFVYFISISFEVSARHENMLETDISLTVTIPKDEIDEVINSYVLDGYNRMLEYNEDENKFNDIYFQVRTESDLNVQPDNYIFNQVGNLLTCYDGDLVETQTMILSVNGNPMIDNQIKLSGSNVWYSGSDRRYSDVLLKMVSPTITKSNNKKWCIGSVSIIVLRDLVS